MTALMLSPPNLRNLFNELDKVMPSVQLGGITGNREHVKNGGYHISRSLLLANGMGSDYSLDHRRDQTGGDADFASAIDLTYGQTAEFHQLCKRLLAAKDDPWFAKYVREFFGCTSTDGPIIGWDWGYGGPTSSADLSHREHVHISFWRDTVNTFDYTHLIEVLTGKPATPPDPTEEAMAFYPNKAAFEAAIEQQAYEGTVRALRDTPVTVAHVWDEAPKPTPRRMNDILDRAAHRQAGVRPTPAGKS